MILLIDNYDSFVHNLARYLKRLGQSTLVVRNDQLDTTAIDRLSPKAIILSPGPCTPREAGCSIEVVRHCSGRFPILGVCLGHQTIAAAWGGAIVRSPNPMHGRASLVFHEGQGIFQGMPSPISVGRYHSLIVDAPQLPTCLRTVAWTEDGTIMGVEHKTDLTVGLQFHPESVLTERGFALLHNFLTLSGIRCAAAPDPQTEIAVARKPDPVFPTGPVTF